MEPITIVMTTWFTTKQRIKVAQDTLKSWVKNMQYDGELRLHIADDGSTLSWEPERYWKGVISYSRQERHGVGASLNAGFRAAYEASPLVFYGVDDWRLDEPFDLTPWAHLLLTKENAGLVRFGPPHPYLRGTIMPYTELWQGWALILERYGLTVGHRPELFHKRFTDYYGMWDENTNAQECERLASVRYADMPNGPEILYALPHPWFHFHLDVLPSTSHIDPRDKNA